MGHSGLRLQASPFCAKPWGVAEAGDRWGLWHRAMTLTGLCTQRRSVPWQTKRIQNHLCEALRVFQIWALSVRSFRASVSSSWGSRFSSHSNEVTFYYARFFEPFNLGQRDFLLLSGNVALFRGMDTPVFYFWTVFSVHCVYPCVTLLLQDIFVTAAWNLSLVCVAPQWSQWPAITVGSLFTSLPLKKQYRLETVVFHKQRHLWLLEALPLSLLVTHPIAGRSSLKSCDPLWYVTPDESPPVTCHGHGK